MRTMQVKVKVYKQYYNLTKYMYVNIHKQTLISYLSSLRLPMSRPLRCSSIIMSVVNVHNVGKHYPEPHH